MCSLFPGVWVLARVVYMSGIRPSCRHERVERVCVVQVGGVTCEFEVMVVTVYFAPLLSYDVDSLVLLLCPVFGLLGIICCCLFRVLRIPFGKLLIF